ncbi:DUF2961 domain-containing protein [Clostridium sp. 19966]|uniref:glycoside hydrolase family 172 protein n=1 Tax=Clostridium sp. 19966 TaxID=2768166 RepID=UPI0028DE1C38|nr:glycoside hydrolase family 172 protein [Clostridium sp. 19966]MDT8719210.1 DUF2961 domain-containing protein [Clostridium sp. 19966]
MDSHNKITYSQLIKRLYDLKALAIAPVAEEKTGNFSSYDRASVYIEETDSYKNWGANDDGTGYIRKEGNSIVALETDGPGVIWRLWSAYPDEGHIKIYIDNELVLDQPFKDYFEKFNGEGCPMNFPNLTPTLSRGRNSYIPIAYQKSCKILLEEGWGAYYHITYSKFPDNVELPSYKGNFDKKSSIELAKADRFLQQRGKYPYEVKDDNYSLGGFFTIKAGGRTIICDKKGRGAITAIKIKPNINKETDIEKAIEKLTISIKWDSDTKASVWAPLGEFLGSAPGINAYKSLPLGMSEELFYCYWYMPFAEGALLEIENQGNIDVSLSIEVIFETLNQPDDNLMRFHAKWHKNSFFYLDKKRYLEDGDRWPDWPLLLAKGRGRFCGVHLHVLNTWEKPEQEPESWWYGRWDKKTIDWWWGEGDEKFFVDGEKFPSTFGTGSEDYIGYAWAAEPPFSIFDSAFACQPYTPIDGNGHTSVSRFHICDNIPFNSSFEGFIEKYKSDIWENTNKCLYAATCYWYQMPGEVDLYDEIETGI